MVIETCNCHMAHKAETFSDSNDFFSLKKYIQESQQFELVPVVTPYSNVGLIENWHKCRCCGAVWRLVEPDFPFTGLWQKI